LQAIEFVGITSLSLTVTPLTDLRSPLSTFNGSPVERITEVHCAVDLSIPLGISHGLMITAVTDCTPSPYCVIDHAIKVILRTRPLLPFSDSSQTNS
jgi:hypothetical protein